MKQVLQEIRDQPLTTTAINFNLLGFTKYGLCLLASTLSLIGFLIWDHELYLALIPLAFYLTEAQLVFLFPLALDGSPHPYRDSIKLTHQAGGPWHVMSVVVPIALAMVFGGFLGRGFRRSWCLGCLSILIWYEDLRTHETR